MKISDGNYYVVHGWMITRLGLKGVDLQLYAIIYGFTQDGESEFAGSVQYLCDFCGGVTRPTVAASLKRLCENGLIEKLPQTINGVTFNRYRIAENFLQGGKNFLQGVEKNFTEVGKNFLHNNNSVIVNLNKEVYTQRVDALLVLWNGLQNGITQVREIKKGSPREKKVTALLKEYSDEEICEAVENIRKSEFLRGINLSGWRITFDWFINQNNFQKVLEGNYSNSIKKTSQDISRKNNAEPDRPASYDIQKAMDEMRRSVPKLKKKQ